MNLAAWLERTAIQAGDRPALFHGNRQVASYGEFRERAASLGAALIARGVASDERVALFMKNCPDYLIALYGIWYAGAVAVPINAKLHPKEAKWIIEDSDSRLVFVTPDLVGALEREIAVPLVDVTGQAFASMTAGVGSPPDSRGPGDLAWLFYTSGTTGRPKGVQITHGMLAATSLCYPLDVDPIEPDDGAFYAAPMSHGAGIYAPIHVRMGARHICSKSGEFDAAELLESARRLGPLSMFMAPTMVRRWWTDAKRSRGDGRRASRRSSTAAGRCTADIVEAVDWFGPKFVQIYGQGECPMGITALSRARTWPTQRIRLARAARFGGPRAIGGRGGDRRRGAVLAAGETGEIMVRGRTVMPGYWENPDATAKTLEGRLADDRRRGRLDADGYLTLTDRSKDVIISGGSNIYPREVEEVLLDHPDVREVSVVGRPDAEWGEVVAAFVVPCAGAEVDPRRSTSSAADHIARFKRPKAYRLLHELPKNNYGKVVKTELAPCWRRRHDGS
jgi:long-chain acyl-CoA synthetase